MGVIGAWWSPRSSKPCGGRANPVLGEFDSHTLPPISWIGDSSMEACKIIHSDPEILGGSPVFIGTRVPADTLLLYLNQGHAIVDFLDDFPSVTLQQAKALLTNLESCIPALA